MGRFAVMQSLDCHAHVDPVIRSAELRRLDACIVAVTRSLGDFDRVRHRREEMTAWGLGCHPGVMGAQKSFDRERFSVLLADASVVGEVGLDGKSRVSLSLQQLNFASILEAVAKEPRIVSVHSAGATGPALEVIDQVRPPGIILHWWKGSARQTAQAIELGCFFSVNSLGATAEALRLLPRERILTETDHPFGDKREAPPRRPGNVQYVIDALAHAWQMDSEDVRRQVWTNFRALTMSTCTADMLPEAFKAFLLDA